MPVPTVHNNLRSFVDFKLDMHNVYIKACKDPMQQWTKLPFVVIDGAIFSVLESWPPKWRASDLVELDMTTTQKQKDEANLRVMNLVEKRCNEKVAAEVRAIHEAARAATEQAKAAKIVATV